jgi:hypothetical protein
LFSTYGESLYSWDFEAWQRGEQREIAAKNSLPLVNFKSSKKMIYCGNSSKFLTAECVLFYSSSFPQQVLAGGIASP